MNSLAPAARLAQAYVFRPLSATELNELARAFTPQRFEPGETIARRGDPVRAWFIVDSGRARITDQEAGAASLSSIVGPGDTLGDGGLLGQETWPFLVRAETPLTALTISSAAFERFVRDVVPGRRTEIARRLAQNGEFEFLKRLRLFAHLPAEHIESLLDALTRVTCARGTYLFREDDPSDCCFIVRRGRMHLLKLVGQSQKQLAVRREGELIGETDLLFGTPRLAGALASTDVELLVLDRALFDEYLPEGPARAGIFQLVSERLLQYQNMLSETDALPDGARIPDLSVRWVRLRRSWMGGVYPFVGVKSPKAAGLACLAMVDAFHRRGGDWQDRLEPLLWEGGVPSLTTFSRTAEDAGYFTRIVTPLSADLPRADLPALVEDDDGTLAVLFDASAASVTVGNPARGVRAVAAEDFQRWWPGRLLTLTTPVPADQVLPLKGHLRSLASIAAAALVFQLFGLGGPLASKVIVDRVLVNGDLSLLQLLLLAVGAVVAFQVAATVLRDYLLAHAAHRATLSLQQRFLHHVLHLTQGAIGARPVADLAVRFRDNERLVERASSAGLTIAVDGVAVIVFAAVLWTISRPAALIALGFVAAYVAVMLAASPLLDRARRRSVDARAALQAHLIETVSGIQTLKTLLVEEIFFERGRRLMTRLKNAEFAASQTTFGVGLVGGALHVAALVAMLGYGAHLAATGRATTGDMVASLGIFGAMLAPLAGLLDARGLAGDVRASLADLREVSSLETEAASTAAVPPPIDGHVLFSHVSFRYPGAIDDVLSDVTLEVLPGQTVAIVGRSGSGKTTLLNLLMRLYPPTSGNIYIDHVDLQSIPSGPLRRQLGVVEQHPFLFDGTIRDNIAKADPSAPIDRVVAAAGLAGIHAFIESLPAGYDTPIGERGAALSGGEKQRLMIARALVGMPRLLLLDEATSAVDSESEAFIQRNIRHAAEGRTTFVIAHRLSTIRHADLIVVLDRGRIVESGTHQSLMEAQGLYYYLNTRTV